MDGAPYAESSSLNQTSIAEQKIHIILALRFEEADENAFSVRDKNILASGH